MQKNLVVFFMAVPVLGFVLYYLPDFIRKMTKKKNTYNESDIKLITSEENFAKNPEMTEEMNIISFDEAMIISSKNEKRSLLLNLLKKDLKKNTSLINSALGDSDSETSHYAASATLELYKNFKNEIKEIEASIALGENDERHIRDLLTILEEALGSGILSNRDCSIYMNRFISVMKRTKTDFPGILLFDDYICFIDYLFLTNDTYGSIAAAIQLKDNYKNEVAYLKLLELYYKTKNQIKFQLIFEEFINSDLILSNKGLEFIRFWNLRES